MSESAATGQGGGGKNTQRVLSIDTHLGADMLIVTRLEGEDALSRCFRFEITVVSLLDGDDAVETLLGRPVTIWIAPDSPLSRQPINGFVRRVTGDGADRHDNRIYRLEVVPALWFLSQTEDCRIFQNQSVPDILETVLGEHGIRDVAFRIIADEYPSVEYCVQFQESALNFVSRLMEHLGLFYWHEHTAEKHVLVIADHNQAASPCQPPNVTLTTLTMGNALRSMEFESVFRPGKWTLNDYDFESPTKRLLSEEPTTLDVARMKDHEIYQYPGYFKDPDAGRHLTRIRMEQEEARHKRVFGLGNCAGFGPGRQFGVTGGRGDPRAQYLLTEVRHTATSYGVEANESETIGYSNEYSAILATIPFRPERVTPKPLMRGAETATVVGPTGESIHCDQYGRVRVQFHWDRRGRRNDSSSCWVRVAQTRAGSYYGSMVIPHVGHEVIVSFLEGDPDRPLITGNVPNALTMPPMELPTDKHKTIQRDHGDNKIVMNGKSGEEQVSVISPRGVNMFASRHNARPLSSGTYSTYSFPIAPTQNYAPNAAPTAGNTVALHESIDDSATSIDIPYYQDKDGLAQLWRAWYGTVKSDIDQATDPTGNAAYGSQTATTGQDEASSFLNWGSEGKINCLVMDNNNLWVVKNANTWINGQVFTQINGGSDVLIYRYSATTILGDNVTTITGGNETFVGGLNMSVNMVESFTFNMGFTQTINLALSNTVNIGPSITTDVLKLDDTGTRISNSETKIRSILTELHNVSTDLKFAQTHLEATNIWATASESFLVM
jgi:type VI secretion system secreted protein VgrG